MNYSYYSVRDTEMNNVYFLISYTYQATRYFFFIKFMNHKHVFVNVYPRQRKLYEKLARNFFLCTQPKKIFRL